MRATVHLADTADFVAFRPLFGSLMAAGLRANYARTLTGVDPDALAAQAAGLLVKRPLTRAQLARDLAAAWPAAEPMSLAYAVTYLVPVVQVPPRGIWGKNAQATWTTAESWLAEPIGPAKPEAVDALVLRYLAAFGPATVADIQNLVRPDPAARGDRPPPAARLPGARRRGTARPPGQGTASGGRPRAAPVPPGVRQPAALARRPWPGHPARAPGPAMARQRRHPGHPADRRRVGRHLEDHRRCADDHPVPPPHRGGRIRDHRGSREAARLHLPGGPHEAHPLQPRRVNPGGQPIFLSLTWG